MLCFFVSILFTGYTPFPGFEPACELGKSARKSIAFLFRLNYFLQYSKLCGESFFFPNSGSIFTSAVTMNPGIVAAMTQRK